MHTAVQLGHIEKIRLLIDQGDGEATPGKIYDATQSRETATDDDYA
jgi:hypothetical protein